MAIREIQFLGTGAADWPWNGPLTDGGIRGSTSTLLNGHILIDAGTTALWNLNRCSIQLSQITDLLITHSHGDHFNPVQIMKIANAPGRTAPLNVYASTEALAHLDDSGRKFPLHWGDTAELELGELTVTVTPSNHSVADLREETFHFLFESDGKRLFYALDGGWLTAHERLQLGNASLDMVVWDATCGNTFDDWRFAEHNDLQMVRSMIRSMQKAGLVREDTVHVFDHVALTLWPQEERAKTELAKEFGGILAFDGMKFTF